MATVSTRKPATRKPQTPAQQIASAMKRARTAKIILVSIGFDEYGFRAEVTSEQDRSVTYTITRDPQTHDLVCTCPATVVCKHIGACLNEGASYHSNAIPASALPITPNPNHPDPEPEPPAPSPAPTFGERQAAANAAHAAMLRAKYGEAPADLLDIIDDDQPIFTTEAAGLAALLDRDSPDDEWEADERPEAEKQAEAERRAEWMRRQAQEEIAREAAKHPCFNCGEPASEQIGSSWVCAFDAEFLMREIERRRWQEIERQARSRQREVALLADAGEFSIWKGVAR